MYCGNMPQTVVPDPIIRTDAPVVFETAALTAASSPITLDINDALGRNATEFTIINDGAGDFTVATSTDGTVFGEEYTMRNGETYSFQEVSIDSIRITHVTDSAFRVTVL